MFIEERKNPNGSIWTLLSYVSRWCYLVPAKLHISNSSRSFIVQSPRCQLYWWIKRAYGIAISYQVNGYFVVRKWLTVKSLTFAQHFILYSKWACVTFLFIGVLRYTRISHRLAQLHELLCKFHVVQKCKIFILLLFCASYIFSERKKYLFEPMLFLAPELAQARPKLLLSAALHQNSMIQNC